MSRALTHAATALVAGLVLALTLAGCGNDEPAAKPLPVAQPSPSTPPGLDTTEPSPPAEVAQTARSAEQFARYFADVVQYAVRIRDITPVAGLARDQAACSSCRQLSDYIEGLKKDKLWTNGDDIQLGRLLVGTRGGPAYNVKAPMTYPRISFVDLQGKEDSSQKVTPYRLDVDLVWDGDRRRWQVDDYTFAEKGRT
jgi:hypothetical protein